MTIIHSEGVMRCEKCGYQEDILIDSDKPSYKDPPRELSFYSYQKINHLVEYMHRHYKSMVSTLIAFFSECSKDSQQ